jgi:hypothetical protein
MKNNRSIKDFFNNPTGTGFYNMINAQASTDLFTQTETKHPEADTIYIIVDNARYYRSCC